MLITLIENYLIPSDLLGVLKRPLSALVLRYDPFATRQAFRVCEAVYLASIQHVFPPEPRVRSVTVLVSPFNYHTMRKIYGNLNLPNVIVRPFKLRSRDLTCGKVEEFMKPYYSSHKEFDMSHARQILREMSLLSDVFDYEKFKAQVHKTPEFQKNIPGELLQTLEAFLNIPADTMIEDNQQYHGYLGDIDPGTLTIVDLSCPFVDKNMACILFNIYIEEFLASKKSTGGKVLAFDEAEKVS